MKGGSSGLAAREVAGVVLDARAIAEVAQHLQVVERSFLDALGFDGLAEPLEVGDLLDELRFDAGDRRLEGLGGSRKKGPRMDHDGFQALPHLAEEGVDG